MFPYGDIDGAERGRHDTAAGVVESSELSPELLTRCSSAAQPLTIRYSSVTQKFPTSRASRATQTVQSPPATKWHPKIPNHEKQRRNIPTAFSRAGRTHSGAPEPFELHSSFARGRHHRSSIFAGNLDFLRTTSNATSEGRFLFVNRANRIQVRIGATKASPALAAPLVPAPRLAQCWRALVSGTARPLWRSALGSRQRRRPSLRPDQPRCGRVDRRN